MQEVFLLFNKSNKHLLKNLNPQKLKDKTIFYFRDMIYALKKECVYMNMSCVCGYMYEEDIDGTIIKGDKSFVDISLKATASRGLFSFENISENCCMCPKCGTIKVGNFNYLVK